MSRIRTKEKPSSAIRGTGVCLKLNKAMARDLHQLWYGHHISLDRAEFLSARVRARAMRLVEILADQEMKWSGRA